METLLGEDWRKFEGKQRTIDSDLTYLKKWGIIRNFRDEGGVLYCLVNYEPFEYMVLKAIDKKMRHKGKDFFFGPTLEEQWKGGIDKTDERVKDRNLEKKMERISDDEFIKFLEYTDKSEGLKQILDSQKFIKSVADEVGKKSENEDFENKYYIAKKKYYDKFYPKILELVEKK